MKEKLELLRAEANDLTAQLKENREKQHELLVATYKDEHKLAEGDEVMLDGKLGKVIGFLVKYNNVEPQVQLRNKDGELGKRIVSVWRWRANKMQKLS